MRVIVIQDHKENRAKCSLTPLEGRSDFSFVRLQHPHRSRARLSIPSGVILHVDGPPLGRSDAELVESGALIIVDSTWERVSNVLARTEAREGARIERRSIPAGIVTAYPRTSKIHEDPPAGLASVEAIFVAMAILGQPKPEILASYRWAKEFLRINAESVRRLRVGTDVLSPFFPA
jgi:pre-rRNA-processing protein TSR3